MQVYAGFSYRRQYAQALKGDFVQYAEPLSASHVTDGCHLAPFEMFPDFAWQLAHSRCEAAEVELAEQVLKERHAGDRVRHLMVRTDVLASQRQAIYLPAYVYEFTDGKHVRRVFVGGVDGAVGGERVYSELASGGVAGLMSAGLAATVFPEPTVRSWVEAPAVSRTDLDGAVHCLCGCTASNGRGCFSTLPSATAQPSNARGPGCQQPTTTGNDQ